jgi:hypothetical protein
MVWNGRLYGTVNAYYDGNNLQVLSHFSRPLNLSTRGDVRGPFRVYSPNVNEPGMKSHVYAGWLAIIPSAWRALFTGSAITGNCCVNLASYQSNGPDAFAWNPDGLTANQTVVTEFYYPPSDPLAVWNTENPDWNGTTKMGGAVFLDSTRTILYAGMHGVGPFCYGNGGATPPDSAPAGVQWCSDPVNNAMGGHAYPYRYQLWAYDANDLQQVMAGQRLPWTVVPYATWNPVLPFAPALPLVNGVAWDPATRRLFLEQYKGDTTRPLIHVFHIH